MEFRELPVESLERSSFLWTISILGPGSDISLFMFSYISLKICVSCFYYVLNFFTGSLVGCLLMYYLGFVHEVSIYYYFLPSPGTSCGVNGNLFGFLVVYHSIPYYSAIPSRMSFRIMTNSI